jgi:hypothetical protein
MKKRFEPPTKAKTKRDSLRDLFEELSEGMKALVDARKGKRTLQTCVADSYSAPDSSRKRFRTGKK